MESTIRRYITIHGEKEPIHGRAMVISDIIRPVVVVSVVRVVICVAPIGGLIMLQRPVAQAGR